MRQNVEKRKKSDILITMEKSLLRTTAVIFVLIGSILLAFLGIISMWGDIEAFVFNPSIRSKKPLSTLSCPAFITPQDDAFVSASINNPSDKPLDMQVRTYISDGYSIFLKEVKTYFTLGPGETETIRVPIFMEDAAYNRVVLVRMHQISRGPLPYLNAPCGVIVFDIPYVTGIQFVALILSLGLLMGAGGIAIWSMNAKPIAGERLTTLRFLILFSSNAFLLALTGLAGWWLLAVFFTVTWIILGSQSILAFSNSKQVENSPGL